MTIWAAQWAQVKQVAIVGTGLLGGSIGLGLRAAGFPGRVVGVGRRLETVRRARQLGCVDEATDDLQAALRQSQLVVLATPLGQFGDLLERVAVADHHHLTITDVGSTKHHVCEQARETLPDATRFVGSHPMAGSERHGPEHAAADLFRGRPCIVTPQDDANPQAVAIVEALWSVLGMRVVRMTPEEHDRQVARISHLPHAVAAMLVVVGARDKALDVASTGFADTTRVASGDADVWGDIFDTNRASVIAAIDEAAGELQRFRALLQNEDSQGVRAYLREAKAVRDALIHAKRQGQD